MCEFASHTRYSVEFYTQLDKIFQDCDKATVLGPRPCHPTIELALDVQKHLLSRCCAFSFTEPPPFDFLSQSQVVVGKQLYTVLDRQDSAEGLMGSVVVLAV